MSGARWLKALCLALLVVIVVDVGFLVRGDALSRETCFTLAAMTAVAGLVPLIFAVYFVRATRRTL